MRWFRVGGDYGPLGGDYLELFIFTSSISRAKELFADRIKRDWPSCWERMGYSNISVWEV